MNNVDPQARLVDFPSRSAGHTQRETMTCYRRLNAQIRRRLTTAAHTACLLIERLNGEIKRRTEIVGIVPNEAAITRLVGAILLKQDDECAVQGSRYMTLETIAPLSDDPIFRLSAVAT